MSSCQGLQFPASRGRVQSSQEVLSAQKTDAVALTAVSEPPFCVLSQTEIIPGQFLQVFCKAMQGKKNLKIEFEGKTFTPYPIPSSTSTEARFHLLLPIPYLMKPHSAQVKVFWEGQDPQCYPLFLREGHYPSEVLKVSSKHVRPPARVLKRIATEQQQVKRLYQEQEFEQMWEGPFILPITSRVTSPFGVRRVYNGGVLKSFHGGLDLRAAVGTPVLAPAGGRVVLAQDLYYTGNTIMLQHGQGLVTFYGHLSRFFVKTGQQVIPGMVLGLSGATGRVSGPHLHWQVYVYGEKVNPEGLLHLKPWSL